MLDQVMEAEFEVLDEHDLELEEPTAIEVPPEAKAVAIPGGVAATDGTSPSTLIAEVAALEVRDADTQARMVELVRGIRAFRKAIAETFDPVIAANHAAHKAAVAAKKKHDDPPAQAEALGKRKIGDFVAAQEREQRQLRIEAERRAAEEARKQKEQEAKAIEATGDTQGAAAVRAERVVPIVAAPVAKPLAAVKGTSTRKIYGIEVFDLMSLVKAVAEGRASIAYLHANEQALRAVAQASKGVIEIPGVKVTETTSTTVRDA